MGLKAVSVPDGICCEGCVFDTSIFCDKQKQDINGVLRTCYDGFIYIQDKETIEDKQLTLKELREQFENNYLRQSYFPTIRNDFPKNIHGKYKFTTDQLKWECYQACAKANGIIKDEAIQTD